MHLRILWVLALTSLLVLLRPSDTQALSLGYTNSSKSGIYSSAVQLLTVNSRQMLPVQQSDLVFPDYLQRSHIISVYEEKVAQSPNSSIFLRLLADQYLRRFREMADVEDVLRAEQAARRSLALQPRHNQVSSMLLASALLSQHQFRSALDVLNNTQNPSVDNPNIVSLLASIQMELGSWATMKLTKL